VKVPEIVPVSFTPYWEVNQSNEDYHADKTAVSSTTLKQILDSPWAFLAAHTNKFKRVESDAFRIGSAIHMAILEPEKFKSCYVISPKFSGTGSMKAKAEWRATLPANAIVLSEDEYSDLQHMIESVQRHPDAVNALKVGQAEVSGYFRDPVTGIKCRIRPDFLHKSEICLVDVKSTNRIDAESFVRSILTYRYHFQMAFYCMGTREITCKEIQLPLFLAIQKTAPFEVAVYKADQNMILFGMREVRNALDRLKQCLEQQSWDSYQKQIQEISLPAWAYN